MAATIGATFMKFGRAPTTLMTLSIIGFVRRPSSVVRSRLNRLSVNSNLEHPTTDNGLKSHGLRIDQRRMTLAELVFRRSPLSALRVSTISGVSEQTRL